MEKKGTSFIIVNEEGSMVNTTIHDATSYVFGCGNQYISDNVVFVDKMNLSPLRVRSMKKGLIDGFNYSSEIYEYTRGSHFTRGS
jgi:hypothetical protein